MISAAMNSQTGCGVVRKWTAIATIAGAGLVLAAKPASGETVVVPNANATTAGNSNNSAPFNQGISQFRYQQVFDNLQFTTFGGTAQSITGVNFRPDTGLNGSAFGPTTLTDVLVQLSTTSREPDNLSETFADNIGSDATTVFDGPLTLSSDDDTSSGLPAFDIRINFSTPFTYDPALGNLLLEIQNRSDSSDTTAFDAEETSGDAVSRVYAFGAYKTSGDASTLGLISQFEFSETAAVVPTPEAAWAGISGLAMLAMGWRRRRTADWKQG